MSWLAKESIDKWFSLLPDDVVSCMNKDDLTPTDVDNDIVRELEGFSSGQEIVEYVISKAEIFADFGRPKRLRFLAWLASRDYPDMVNALQLLTDGENSDGGSGGIDKVAPLFLEDIRALVAALGPRAAQSIVDAATLNIVKGAGFEVANEMDMKSGGSL